jgi:hypothetical protein
MRHTSPELVNPSTTAPRRRRPVAVLLLIVAVVSACAAPSTSGSTPSRAAVIPSPRPTIAIDAPLEGAATPDATVRTGASPTATATLGPAAPSTTATAPSQPPAATPVPATPVPPKAAFVQSLYHRGDYVAQYTFEWCVGASLQMALRMTGVSEDESRAQQQALWEMARDRSFSPFGGANPRGWTAALNDLGIGPYVLVSIPTFDEAVRIAAEAMRATDRPVGLVMWRGRHAWVMSGYESVGDPAVHDDFEVTGVRVLDPLHPHGSRVWGPSPAPNALISLETLGRQFVLRDSTRVNLGVPPGFLLVLPVVS